MAKVAVYGSLRKQMGNHRLMVGIEAQYLGTTFTTESYTMYSLGGFPKVQLGRATCPIKVEVYEVDDEGLARLNQLEGYRGEGRDNFYDRSEIQTNNYGPALMYHIEGEGRQESIVPDGDWVNYRGVQA